MSHASIEHLPSSSDSLERKEPANERQPLNLEVDLPPIFESHDNDRDQSEGHGAKI